MIFEKAVLKMYRGMAFSRCDDRGTAYYFSAKDFDGLQQEPYAFESSLGHQLQGYFYCYENPIENRIIVFDHGFGGGHRSYMREIELLCRHGFCVFAYDHTGCMESGGACANGMSQSLRDLNDCLVALKSDERFSKKDFSVIGHSWGGFSTLNIVALHPYISHIVAISGFVSVEMLVNSFFGGIMKGYRKAVMALEETANPQFIKYHAVNSLADTNAKVLLIYSDNDHLCRKDPHYDLLKASLSHRDNIRFLLVEGKGHNPNYTKDAVAYLAAYSADVNKMTKKKRLQTEKQRHDFVASYDWWRMTEQDERVWEEIFKTLDM